MLVEKLGLTPFLPEEATFTDVPLDHQASGYIYACVKEGLIRGYPDGTFRPEGAVTRAEFAAIVCKAFTILPYRPETPTYTDVPPDNWAYEFIEALTLKGIAKGYPDGTFHPDDFILRSEAADALNAFPRSCLTVR